MNMNSRAEASICRRSSQNRSTARDNSAVLSRIGVALAFRAMSASHPRESPPSMAEPNRKNEGADAKARAHIASALRTFDKEAGGITALATAIRAELGRPFIAAVELLRGARGRVIVT